MAKNCLVCKRPTIFYVWTTDRNFNLEKLQKLGNIKDSDMELLKRDGDVVCFRCKDENKLMER